MGFWFWFLSCEGWTDQRHKIGKKMLDQLGYGVEEVKKAIIWWYKAVEGPIWFEVERIFGKNGVKWTSSLWTTKDSKHN